MKLLQEDIEFMLQKSKLRFEEKEMDKLKGNLEEVLCWLDGIELLELEGVELPTQESFSKIESLREDRVIPSSSREDALTNAPDTIDCMFVVPRIL